MTNEQLNCKNCEHPLEASHKFCPECGQKTDDKLTIKVLFSNTISNYFSVDARFFVSFMPLLFKPGSLPREFVGGKRLKYLHPAQFYLFISVVFFFLLSFEARDQQEAFEKSVKSTFDRGVEIDSTSQIVFDSIQQNLKENLSKTSDLDTTLIYTLNGIDTLVKKKNNKSNINFGINREVLDSLVARGASREEMLAALGYKDDQSKWKKRFYIQLLKFYEKRGGGLLQAFYDTIPIAMFFLLPIYALLLKLFFFRRGRFSVHLVFSFYFFSFLFTVFSIMLFANLIYPIPTWINWLIILGTAIYLVVGIKKFYEIRVTEALVRSIAVSFLYFLFIIPTSLIILSLVTFLIY
jgi:hypothetical protein